MLDEVRSILAMRLAVTGRRYPAVPLFIAFGWIATAFLLVQTWFFARSLPGRPQLAGLAELIAVPGLCLVWAVGLPATWRLAGDRRWFAWLITRGSRPSAVLASLWIERAVRVSVGASFVGAYLAGLHKTHAVAAAISFITFVSACSLLLGGVQTVTALAARVLSGRSFLAGLLTAALIGVVLYPLLEAVGSAASGSQELVATLLARFGHHPLAGWLGLRDLVELGTGAPAWADIPAGGRILLRICVLGAVGYVAMRWGGDRLGQGAASGQTLLMRRVARAFLAVLRRVPAGWVAQGCMQWVLLLRQGSIVAALWTLGALAVLVFVKLTPDGVERLPALLPLAALLVAHGIGTDGVGEMLGRAAPYHFYRACGTDPGDYGAGVACAASGVAIMVVLACTPILATACTPWQAASSAASACVLAVADAALATLISLYLQPILPRLGILGQIKSGLILVGSAWLMLMLFSAFALLPLLLMLVFWAYKKRSLAGFVWRRLWKC